MKHRTKKAKQLVLTANAELTCNPAVSEAQRRYLNMQFGHDWVKAHSFDNRGPLPERVTEEGEGSTRSKRKKKLPIKNSSLGGCVPRLTANAAKVKASQPHRADPSDTLALRKGMEQFLSSKFAQIKRRVFDLLSTDGALDNLPPAIAVANALPERKTIPIVEVPDVRQRDHYSCGAACAMSVGQHFGVGPDSLEQWKHLLGTDVEESTHPQAIIDAFEGLGLHVVYPSPTEQFSLSDLARFTQQGMPAIVCCQDYGPEVPSKARYSYGHYIVILGVIPPSEDSNGYVIAQDPSEDNVVAGGDRKKLKQIGSIQKPGRVLIDAQTFDAMWHDETADGVKLTRFGIVVGPKGPSPTVNAVFQEDYPGGPSCWLDPHTGEQFGHHNPRWDLADNSNPEGHNQYSGSSRIAASLPSASEWKGELEKVWKESGRNETLEASNLSNLCHPVTKRLQEILMGKGLDVEMMGGNYKRDDGHSEGHYWLEHTDKKLQTTIIDPTESQYSNAPMGKISVHKEGSEGASRYKQQLIIDNASFFAKCARDALGHCLSGTSGVASKIADATKRAMKVAKDKAVDKLHKVAELAIKTDVIPIASDFGREALLKGAGQSNALHGLPINDIAVVGTKALAWAWFKVKGMLRSKGIINESVYNSNPEGHNQYTDRNVLYHGTHEYHLPTIEDKGVEPGDDGLVHASKNYAQALTYGLATARRTGGDVVVVTVPEGGAKDAGGLQRTFDSTTKPIKIDRYKKEDVIEALGNKDVTKLSRKDFKHLVINAALTDSETEQATDAVLMVFDLLEEMYGLDADTLERPSREEVAKRIKNGPTANATTEQIDQAASQADPNPTEAQREAGTYKKGHVIIQGLLITIETAKGNKRKPWHEKALAQHYGYIKRTTSEADGDHVDVFIGPNPSSDLVFVVDQVKPPEEVAYPASWSDTFDEHKCLVGFSSIEEAEQAYRDNYANDWQGFGGITQMTIGEFKRWLREGDTSVPVANVSFFAECQRDPKGHCMPGTGKTVEVGSDIKLAAKMLAKGAKVKLDQPEQVSTLLRKMQKMVAKAVRLGEAAPTFDLCKVSVEGTNLFCQDNIGIPRVQMPQMSGIPQLGSEADKLPKKKSGKVDIAPLFVAHLRQGGTQVEETKVRASHLRASQNQIDGAKIAQLVKEAKEGTRDLREKPIFITRDNYVVDGHHHWAAIVGLGSHEGKDFKIPVYKIDTDIGTALHEANKYAAKMGLKGESVPSANSDSSLNSQRVVQRFPDLLFDSPTVNASDRERVANFQGWLRDQLHDVLLNPEDEELWRKYSERGFKKGGGRAFDTVRGAKKGEQIGELFRLPEGGEREEFLRQHFASPESVEKVKLLAGRALDDLKNVTHDMSTKMSRLLADGLVGGKSPKQIARKMAKEVDISKGRAKMIAHTELVRAHAEGTLDMLQKRGVKEVGAEVEWSTAADETVCPKCKKMEGKIFTIDEARGLIPAHPYCSCRWLAAREDATANFEPWSGTHRRMIVGNRAFLVPRASNYAKLLELGRSISKLRLNSNPEGINQYTYSPNPHAHGSPEHIKHALKNAMALSGDLTPLQASRILSTQGYPHMAPQMAQVFLDGIKGSSTSASPESATSQLAASKRKIVSQSQVASKIRELEPNQMAGVVPMDKLHDALGKPDLKDFHSHIQAMRRSGAIEGMEHEGRHGITDRELETAIIDPRSSGGTARITSFKVRDHDQLGKHITHNARGDNFKTCERDDKGHCESDDSGGRSKEDKDQSKTNDKSKFIGAKVGKEEHEAAARVEEEIAKAIGGKVMPREKGKQIPIDVLARRDGVEVKSLLKGGKQSLSVHEDALLRKVDWKEGCGGCGFHTIAVDERNSYDGGAYAQNYSGNRIYYKRGSGRYSLSQMHPVKSAAELRRLLKTPDDQLPEKAKGRLPEGEEVAKLRVAAEKAHAARLAKDRARKARLKAEKEGVGK